MTVAVGVPAVADLFSARVDGRVVGRAVLGVGDPEFVGTYEDLMAHALEMFMYAQALGEDRKANPQDDITSVMMAAEVDGEQLAELGPGAVLGERASLDGGVRTATLRAVTDCKVAAVPADAIDRHALIELADGHRREESTT